MPGHHPRHEVELFRDEGEFVVYVDLPDGDPEVNVRWHDGDLTVVVEHADEETGRSRVQQRHVGFHRPIRDGEITATVDDGVLEVHLPIDESEERSGTSIEVT